MDKREQRGSSWSGERCQQSSGLWWARPHRLSATFMFNPNPRRTTTDRAKTSGQMRTVLTRETRLSNQSNTNVILGKQKQGKREKRRGHTWSGFNSRHFILKTIKVLWLEIRMCRLFSKPPFIEKSIFHSPNLLYPKDCTSSSSAKSSVWSNNKHDKQ